MFLIFRLNKNRHKKKTICSDLNIILLPYDEIQCGKMANLSLGTLLYIFILLFFKEGAKFFKNIYINGW